MIDPNTFQFLKELEKNNNKEWFQDHRKWYNDSKSNFIDFSAEVLEGLKLIQPDLINTDIKKCILRINRDIRFSKDKRPYKNYFGAGFGPGGKSSGRIDFYFQIQAHNQSMLGAGMWSPTAENLAKFRQEIDYNPQDLKSLIQNKAFRKFFNEIEGQRLKTKPKGYELNHPDIELLKYKELFFLRRFKETEVCQKSFDQTIIKGCKLLKPYQDYLNALFFDDF
ncbi:DUF2461 domain-containing protein [uncultured Arcticibacterium sp.]|uniref:DUF2461 domain-containing protein n=1 Tax=uncultured Arcticibacterium sp. TaxID=2173042 RepID=UPI0030F773FE